MKYLFVAAAIALSLSFMPVHAAGVNMQPGMWEWSMTMEMPGMPMAMPPTVYSSCVTKDDLLPKQSAKDDRCKTLKNQIKGNSVLWKIECSSAGGMATSEGTMTYSGATARGEIQSSTQGMAMMSKITGRRTGSCK